jgi:hypothetical protein
MKVEPLLGPTMATVGAMFGGGGGGGLTGTIVMFTGLDEVEAPSLSAAMAMRLA